MSLEKVTVLAPATIANVGPGFDVFGLALGQPYDLVTAEVREGKGVKIRKVEGLGEHHDQTQRRTRQRGGARLGWPMPISA
jgi:homoserine kinase